ARPPSSCSSSSRVLTRLPLWPIATARRGPRRKVGWAFSQTVEPVVEYRQWAIARSPRRPGSRRSSSTWATMPRSLYRKISAPSLTARPADSWPRCWSAISPVEATAAASVPEPGGSATPTTPHISAALHACRGHVPAEGTGQAVLPGAHQVHERHVDRVGDAGTPFLGGAGRAGAREVDEQPVAPDDADRLHRQAVLSGEELDGGCVPGHRGDDQAAGAFPEEVDRRRARDRQADVRAETRPDHYLRERDGEPAARDVLGGLH